MSSEQKQLDFFVIREGDEVDAVTEEAFLRLFPSKETATAAYGEAGKWESLTVRPALGRFVDEITRGCYLPDDLMGFRYAPYLEAKKRFEVMVQGWTLPLRPNGDSYDDLHPAIKGVIDQALQVYLNPGASSDRLFFRALRKPPTPSEEARDSSGTPSIPE